jgi:hypothetical protein
MCLKQNGEGLDGLSPTPLAIVNYIYIVLATIPVKFVNGWSNQLSTNGVFARPAPATVRASRKRAIMPGQIVKCFIFAAKFGAILAYLTV